MHPIIGCATDVQAALKGVASVEPTFMSVGEKQSALVALTEARSQLDALTARVIAEAVDALPSHVAAETRGLAEATLVELAARHDARDLRRIGKRILDVVAPEVGECHEESVLATEQARAAAGVELTLVDDGEGRCHGRFTAPSHVGAMLKRHLLALANPARHTEAELRDDTSPTSPTAGSSAPGITVLPTTPATP